MNCQGMGVSTLQIMFEHPGAGHDPICLLANHIEVFGARPMIEHGFGYDTF